MDWYIFVFGGIIIGGIIFNARLRKGFLDFLGGLGGSGKSFGGNIIDKRSNRVVEAPAGSYSVPIHCTNCRFKGGLLIRKGDFKGQLIADSFCPECGCKTLKG